MAKPKIREVLLSDEFQGRLYIALLILLGILLPNPWKILCLVLSGVASGLYYGCYNDIIWRPNKEEDLSDLPHYRAHQMWIHIFCSVAGSITLYTILILIESNDINPLLEKHGFNLLTLAFVTIMGYVGLLPRLLWFTSYGLGQFGKPSGKQ